MNDTSPETQMMPIIMGLMTSSAVYALARLGIPDHLESGPKTTEELAEATAARPELLARLMRATEGMGVLARTPDGKWTQTPMSELLRTNSKKSLRDLAVFMADDWHMLGFGSLDETVRTGEPATERIYGEPAFEYLRRNPDKGEHFNRAMTSFSVLDAPAVLEAYDFAGIESLTDVAGGHGLLLTSILDRYPEMTGTLFDLPEVIRTADSHLSTNKEVRDRLRMVEGDMFGSVPPGADVYIIKRIIHDWPDEQCTQILSNCREGVGPNGRLIVVDAVVPGDAEFSPAKIMDLTMMLFVGGKERTEEEFRELLEASGWKLSRVIPTASQLSVIEGLPA
jgi:hypothetical protein